MTHLFVAGIYQLDGFTGELNGAIFNLCFDHFNRNS